MDQLAFEALLYTEGRLSLSKAAMLCCMISNDLDGALVAWLAQRKVRAVITRAGGSGDNLKSKLLRNAFGAAENSGLLAVSPRNRYAITRLVEDVMRSIDSPLLDVAGGGVKIGLVACEHDLALGLHGSFGIPGMDVDYEVSLARTLNHYLEA
ncbi:MAG TPA: HutP family protein [Candidatus Ozemobacteraceae bacterium]|nr:HutP family protein [Candidatus Ozemobacteraceae bacterium]